MSTLNKKILINSYPRSGSTTFMQCIRLAAWRYLPQNSGIFFHEDDWVVRSHIPLAFMGRYPDDVVICTIVRDPLDCIASNVYRWSKGYTGNIVNGKLAIDANMAKQEFVVDEVLLDMIDHQISQYISYMKLYVENHQNVVGLSYGSTQNRLSDCLDILLPDLNDLAYSQAEERLEFLNAERLEKTAAYFDIQNAMKQFDSLEMAISLYDKAKGLVAI